MPRFAPKLLVISVVALVFLYLFRSVLRETTRQMLASIDQRSLIAPVISVPVEFNANFSRDYFPHPCKDARRVGTWGWGGANGSRDVDVPTNETWRLEGSWYVCMDDNLAPVTGQCAVLSFGVNADYGFDRGISKYYDCQLESFDPFIETNVVEKIRNSSSKLAKAVTLPVTARWRFHRLGLASEKQARLDKFEMGSLASFSQILEYVNLKDKVIDVIKMDIEGYEWKFLNEITMDYMCANVKQFMLETHTDTFYPNIDLVGMVEHVRLMRKLEKCFRLFRRDMRFFAEDWKPEFQPPVTFNLSIALFKSEQQLIDYMVTYGELYFLNINFVRQT